MQRLPQGFPSEGRGHRLTGTLLRERIWKDYYQFLGTFSEALDHRIAFQERVRAGWKTRLTNEGRRERRQIGIEWMESAAMSTLEVISDRGESRRFSKTGFNRIFANRVRARRRPSEAEKLFHAAIGGKRVLVLGPGITEPLSQQYINRFDVVATPKLHSGFWAEGLAGVVNDSPLTVVTYLNHKIVNAMRSAGSVTDNVWDFARVKSLADALTLERLSANVISGKPVIGVMNSPDQLLMNTYGPLMGTAMVFDLLLAKPQSLFLMGFSFFVQDGNAYNSNYESASHTDDFTLNSLRAHGTFSNFLFLKNLYHFGLVQADDATARILSLSSSEYAERLDIRFGLKSPGGSKKCTETLEVFCIGSANLCVFSRPFGSQGCVKQFPSST